MPQVCEAHLSLDDLFSPFFEPLIESEARRRALEAAIQWGPLMSKARVKAAVLAHHVRTPQRWTDMLAVCDTVRVALDLIITTQQLNGAEKTDPTIVLADTWRSDGWARLLAPVFIHAAAYVREHEELHGTAERAMQSFDCDPVGNKILFATASTMHDGEKALLHELLSLCARVTTQIPPVGASAERSDAARHNGR